MENLTREHGLVREITNGGWFSNPAGKQGYEVILLERVGDGGARYYCSLKPGETLRISERILKNYVALEVDIRHARAFPVSGAFNTRDNGKKVSIQLNIRYFVTDARIVAQENVDPLGELISKVVASLTRKLQNYSEHDITPAVIEQIVRGVGQVPHLGLMVEDVELLFIAPDSRTTKQVVEGEDIRHGINVGAAKRQADIQARVEEEGANLEVRLRRQNDINLSNLNILLQEYPEVIPQIVALFALRQQKVVDDTIDVVQRSIQEYLDQIIKTNAKFDPRQISKILRAALNPNPPQRTGRSEMPQITWGDDVIPGETQYADKEEATKEENDKAKATMINFGEPVPDVPIDSRDVFVTVENPSREVCIICRGKFTGSEGLICGHCGVKYHTKCASDYNNSCINCGSKLL